MATCGVRFPARPQGKQRLFPVCEKRGGAFGCCVWIGVYSQQPWPLIVTKEGVVKMPKKRRQVFSVRRVYRVGEVADMLGLSANSVYALVRSGQLRTLPKRSPFSDWRIPAWAVDEFVGEGLR